MKKTTQKQHNELVEKIAVSSLNILLKKGILPPVGAILVMSGRLDELLPLLEGIEKEASR